MITTSVMGAAAEAILNCVAGGVGIKNDLPGGAYRRYAVEGLVKRAINISSFSTVVVSVTVLLSTTIL